MKSSLSFNKLFLALAFLSTSALLHAAEKSEIARWEQEAAKVTIVRDDWGIAHIYGKTDADTVFGMEYAQAEDDFNRVETNYINAMGRLAETEGESKIYLDLRMKLFIDPVALQKQYAESPEWLKTLMNSFADGLNFYLYKHPEVKPRVIQHFEPWMALSFTEGSIGGDIERVNLSQLEAFYSKAPDLHASNRSVPPVETAYVHESDPPEPTGSNGMAIAPSNTANHHALLLINPHTSFFFRSELQMVSDQGLDAYGAVTWGQFFIYQGFVNEHTGWMHTSSGVDAVDEYLETIESKDGHFSYRYGREVRPLISKQIAIPYKTDKGILEKKFTVYYSHHGPIIREQNGKWVSIALMNEPVKALTQSYTRTKTKDYKSFRQTLELKANSSNNTIFADSGGDIAYFHGNFIPRRDTSFDFTKPVDGSNPATDWKGLLTVDELPQLLDPKSGWLYNSNNWPWSGAGESSLRKQDYPAYVESGTESARGLHAIRVLKDTKDFTLDSLIAAAYDSYLPWFEKPIPALIKAWDDAPASDPMKDKLAGPIALLRTWDYRWSVDSVPTSLAVFWGEDIRRHTIDDARKAGISVEEYIGTKASGQLLLQSLSTASDRLTADFGAWKTPWGNINRFQRLTGDIVQPFNDAGPSIPVGFTSSLWGSLASFGARPYPGTKKWYGTSGNSFVAVVEFGEKIHAKAVTAGGESGNPLSPYFNDQAKRYSTGDLREVYFYRSDLKGHASASTIPEAEPSYLYMSNTTSTTRSSSLRDLCRQHGRTVSTSLATVLACIVLLPLLGHKPLTNWDEGIYAEISREMLSLGPLVPHWNYQPWFEKPPLMLWITALFFKLFGVNEFWARAGSALSGVAVVALLHGWLISQRDNLAAWLSTFILLSTFGFLHVCRVGEMDVLLSLGCCIALCGLSAIQSGRLNGWYFFWAGFSVALMTKGAASMVLIITVLVVAIFERWNTTHLARPFWLSLSLASLAILPWHLYMFHRFGTAFLTEYLGFHVLARATHQIEDHVTHWWYYFWVLLISAAPFVVLYPFAIASALKRKDLRVWAIFAAVVICFFTIAQTRLPHYIAPAYPALTILTSVFLAEHLRQIQRSRKQSPASFWIISTIAAASLCIAAALLTAGPRRTLHQAKVGPDVVYAEKESIQLLREVFRHPQPTQGALLVWWDGNSRSIATSVFYSRRPVQQIQLQPLAGGVPTDKYLFQPLALEVALASGPRIILLDKPLVQKIPGEFSYSPIISGLSMELGIIARK